MFFNAWSWLYTAGILLNEHRLENWLFTGTFNQENSFHFDLAKNYVDFSSSWVSCINISNFKLSSSDVYLLH